MAITDFALKFGVVLKTLNLSRGRVAQATGIDKSVVSRWASGVQEPTDHNLSLLTTAIASHRPGFSRKDWDLHADTLEARLNGTEARLPDKPSIVVLPFPNMSGDPEQEYFADGIVDDIITALCRNKSLFVIARSSSFAYKGRAVDVKQIGLEFGVRYLLEGSVRKSANRVRITCQLIDTESATHIWADRFDGLLEDVFELQDRITANVVSAISPTVERAEIARSRRAPTENLQAYGYYLRGMSHFYEYSKAGNDSALDLFHKAIGIDSEFVLAYSQAAFCYVQRKAFGWSTDLAQDAAEAGRLVRRSLELDGRDPRVLANSADVLFYLIGNLEEAVANVDLAIELDPNSALGWSMRGWTKLALGMHEMALDAFGQAVRLSPLDPKLFLAQSGMAWAHFFLGRYDDALSLAAKSLRLRPNFIGTHTVFTSSHAMAGHRDAARQACAAYQQAYPGMRISSIKKRMVVRRAEDVEKVVRAMRLAGMPE
jgi:adenylate cyclase